MHRRIVLLAAGAVLGAALLGCGGGNTPTTASNGNPMPGPPGAQPPPNPSPTPPPGTSNPEMYMTHMVTESAPPQSDVGQLTMNATANDGSGKLTLHNVDASRTYSLKFCPQSSGGLSGCIDLGSFTTDASGSATHSFKFTKPGTWAGGFSLSGGSVAISDGFFGGATAGLGFQAPLYRVQSVTTGIAANTNSGAKLGNEPLTSGQLTINNGVVTATLKGAAPNTTYTYGYVLGYAMYGGSSDYGSNMSFTTDASGNGSGNFTDMFGSGNEPFTVLSLVFDNNGAQFVAGFRVQ